MEGIFLKVTKHVIQDTSGQKVFILEVIYMVATYIVTRLAYLAWVLLMTSPAARKPVSNCKSAKLHSYVDIFTVLNVVKPPIKNVFLYLAAGSVVLFSL